MGRSRYTGAISSGAGFRFVTAGSGNRPMTITCTSLVRTAANSPGQNATVINTAMGGLSKVTAAWGQVRQRTAATFVMVLCQPRGAANSITVYLRRNVGTGDFFEGRNCTVDVFALGYVS